MTDDLDPAVYERAADVLDRDGWIRGALHTALGRCAVGALREASETPDYMKTDWSLCDPLRVILGDPDLDLAVWNDAPGRTKDEVVDLFRTAAEKLRADRGELA